MNCEEFKKNISKYILGRLEPELRDAFEEHYFGCQECFQQLELKDALATIIRDEGVEGILGQAPEVDRADALLEYADAAEILGDFEEAAKLLKKALEVRPDDENLTIKITERLLIVWFNSDINKGTEESNKYFELAEKLCDNDNLFDSILKAVMTVIAKKFVTHHENKNYEQASGLGLFLEDKHFFEPEQHKKLADILVDSLFMRGMGLISDEQYESSITFFDGVLKRNPDFYLALVQKGLAYFYNEEWDNSEKHLLEALKYLPDDFMVNLTLGKICWLKTNLEKAEHFFRKSNKIEPDNPKALYGLGLASYYKMKFDDAISFLLRAFEIDPDDKEIIKQLGRAYLQMGEYESAALYLTIAKKIDPNDHITLNNLAAAMFSLGNVDGAKELLVNATIEEELEASIYCNLATISFNKNDTTNARHFVELAYKLNPNHPTIVKNRDIILGKTSGTCASIEIH